MSSGALEERAVALETQMAEVLRLVKQDPPKDAWWSVVGMFADDLDIDVIHEEAQRIREENRQATRDEFEKIPGLSVQDWTH